MILVERNSDHLVVKLNRPDVRNAFNPEMIEKLTEVFRKTHQDPQLKSVSLMGEGGVFCAGADLGWMQSLVSADFDQNKKDAEKLHGLFQALWDCPVPVISVVRGAAFGGALGLLACSDYVICEDTAQMSFSEVKLGIAPAVISEFLIKKCNVSHLNAWMISGLLLKPVEVEKSGLVHVVVPQGSVQAEYDRYLKSLQQAGPHAVRETKKLTRLLLDPKWGSSRDLTTQLIARLRVSPEGQEGLKSFLEKRKSSWQV